MVLPQNHIVCELVMALRSLLGSGGTRRAHRLSFMSNPICAFGLEKV